MHPAQPTFSHHTCIEVKQSGGHGAAFSKTILHFYLQKLTLHTYPHLHVLMEGANDVNQQLWDAKLAYHHPQSFTWKRIIGFFRSTKIRYCLALCAIAFSVSCRTVRIMSVYPRHLLNLHWDSGSNRQLTSIAYPKSISPPPWPSYPTALCPKSCRSNANFPSWGWG